MPFFFATSTASSTALSCAQATETFLVLTADTFDNRSSKLLLIFILLYVCSHGLSPAALSPAGTMPLAL